MKTTEYGNIFWVIPHTENLLGLDVISNYHLQLTGEGGILLKLSQ